MTTDRLPICTASRRNWTGEQQLLLLVFFLAPALLIVGKWSALPTSGFLNRSLTLAHIPADMAGRVQYVLLLPMGAVLIVFFRLTLGIRLLGPFRSLLIAVAFQVTGIAAGLVFLVFVVGVIVVLRRLIRTFRLPYFARVSVILGAVSSIMVAALLLCEWLGIALLGKVAYFPIVVICLTGEGFARALTKEGVLSALWRGGMTALAAVLITLLASIPGLTRLIVDYPELLLAQVGAILVIAQYGNLRLLARWNPPPKKPRRKCVRKACAVVAQPVA
jgi:hypothetical protein